MSAASVMAASTTVAPDTTGGGGVNESSASASSSMIPSPLHLPPHVTSAASAVPSTSSVPTLHSFSPAPSSTDEAVTPTEFLRWREEALSDDEETATHAFLAVVNPWRSTRGYEPLPWPSAVKFLMARKFNVERALVLYQQHELMRIREGLTVFDPTRSPLKEELETGKFTILPGRDANGATLALFNAHKHEPNSSVHRTTLQGVVYQLDVALEEVATQRGGLIFVYNMSGSKYSNFDYDLSQKMLTLLKGAYPARLKKVLIVTAPLWFKAPFKVLRLFVREKLRDRVFTVSIPQLQLHIAPEELPKDLGGQLEVDHSKWLERCAEVAENKDGELVTMSSSQPTTPAEHKKRQQPTLEQLETLPVKAGSVGGPSPSASSKANGLAKLVIEQPPPAPPPEDEDSMRVANGVEDNGHEAGDAAAAGAIKDDDPLVSSNSSGLSDDETNPLSTAAETSGMTLPEFIEHVRVKGRRGLYEEYSEIKNRPPMGTFHHSRAFENQVKNRYTDVLCYDHSRVVLGVGDGCEPEDVEDGDYINANYVDGYKQPRAFISSQGPLPRTFGHFWQMIWEQKVLVVVMTTKAVERHRTKCGQYWPEDVGASLTAGRFEVSSGEIENCEDFVVTHLTLRDTRSDETRRVCHFQFVSWPDYGVPDSALSMLHFLQRVREKQAELLREDLAGDDAWSGHELGPPIVVHCSAGIGRTGTFATLDIAIRKFEDVGRVDVQSTVERIRSQRAFSIQMPDQYVFCHLAFLEYVLNMEYVEEIDLTGFDDDCDSD